MVVAAQAVQTAASILEKLTGPEALQQTIAWGVQRGLFAYALGDGQTLVHLHLRLEASGEIDANLVDLSVKESVLQFNPRGKVDVESSG